MKRSWLLCAVALIVASVAYVATRREARRKFNRAQRAMRVVDANMAEIRRPREDWSQRSDEAIAESARRELDDTDLVALAEHLHLKLDSSR